MDSSCTSRQKQCIEIRALPKTAGMLEGECTVDNVMFTNLGIGSKKARRRWELVSIEFTLNLESLSRKLHRQECWQKCPSFPLTNNIKFYSPRSPNFKAICAQGVETLSDFPHPGILSGSKAELTNLLQKAGWYVVILLKRLFNMIQKIRYTR